MIGPSLRLLTFLATPCSGDTTPCRMTGVTVRLSYTGLYPQTCGSWHFGPSFLTSLALPCVPLAIPRKENLQQAEGAVLEVMHVWCVPSLVQIFVSGWDIIDSYLRQVFMKSIGKSQFPHKSVNLFFTLAIIKDKLTDLWGR